MTYTRELTEDEVTALTVALESRSQFADIPAFLDALIQQGIGTGKAELDQKDFRAFQSAKIADPAAVAAVLSKVAVVDEAVPSNIGTPQIIK